MRPLRGEDGVTLVELLVSMTIMGFVLVLAGPTLLSALGATNRLQATQSAIDDGQLVVARLERELRSAVCISSPAENASGSELVFDRLDGARITYTVTDGEVSRREGTGTPQVLATEVAATTSAFTQVATPLRTVEVAIPMKSDSGGSFLLKTAIAGRNAWRSC